MEDWDSDDEYDKQPLWLLVSKADALKLGEPLDENDFALVALDLSDALPVDVYESVDVPVVVEDVVWVALCVPETLMRADLEPLGEWLEVFETLIEPVVVGLIRPL